MDALFCLLILFACSICLPLLAKVPFLIRVLRKKEAYEAKPFWLGVAYNAGFAFLFNLLVFLFLLFFNSPVWYRALYLYATLSGISSFLRLGERIVGFIRNRKVERREGTRVFGTIALTAAFLLFDAFFFNQAALKSHNGDPVDVSPTSSYVSDVSGFTVKGTSLQATSTRPSFVVSGLPENVKYATFDFEKTNSQFTLDIATRQSGSWKTVQSYEVNANYEEYCRISLVKEADQYLFTFRVDTTRDGNERNFVLNAIHFNQIVPYNYSLTRGLVILLSCAILSKIPGYVAKRGEPAAKTGRIKLGLLGGFLVSFFVLLIVAIATERGPSNLLVDYPLNQATYRDYDIFVKLFDAFKKGQLNLDYPVDAKLIALGEDVYDPAARTAAGASFLFDHAFYGGKYYCYFGAAPVILVSFPVYLIAGGVPTGFFLLWTGFLVAAFGLAYLALVLTEAFRFKPNPLAYGLLVLCLACGGLFLNLVVFRRTDFMYRVPFTLGLANAILFTAFTLEAYRGYHRRTFLGLAAFFYVVIMGTRPDFGLWVLFLSPLFLSMLFRKEKPLAKRLFDFVPMAAILVLGAALLVSYNLARYGNPFEFGQSYQLTSNDMRKIKLELGDFRGAFFHFFLQAPNNRDTFGYITTAYTAMPFDSHPYHGTTIGLLYTPLPYFSLFLIPCFIKERRLELRFAYVLMPLTVLGIAWSVYGLGGTCFRYMLAIYPLTAIIGLFAVARFMSLEWNNSVRKIAYYAMFGGAICCFILGMNLVPVSFDGMHGEDMGGVIYYAIRDMLGAYNTL